MDIDRARSIFNSTETIGVLYQGTPVWIEAIQDEKNAVILFPSNRERYRVPVKNLIEKYEVY